MKKINDEISELAYWVMIDIANEKIKLSNIILGVSKLPLRDYFFLNS